MNDAKDKIKSKLSDIRSKRCLTCKQRACDFYESKKSKNKLMSICINCYKEKLDNLLKDTGISLKFLRDQYFEYENLIPHQNIGFQNKIRIP